MTKSYSRRYLALRTGVAAAAASISGSLSRGLLPRSASDQAITTGAAAAIRLGVGVLSVSATEALADIVVARTGRGDAQKAVLATSAAVAIGSFAAVRSIPDRHDVPLPIAAARTTSYLVGTGAGCAAAVLGTDLLLERRIGQRNPVEGILVATAIGSAVSGINMYRRSRRANALGERDRHQVQRPDGMVAMSRSIGLGALGGVSILALAAAEFTIAEVTSRTVAKVVGANPLVPLAGHTVAIGALGAAGAYGVNIVRRRIEHADDVVEPAYPEPPTSPWVTAGPNSIIGFDTIGKEGRRFVTMALSASDIEAVMQEPSTNPVRAVAGYESARDISERAALALEELERLGAYDRSVICIAAPTGVGYVNYSFAEALEYLTRGSCAIIVTQYALVPSALALNRTEQGRQLHTLVLEGVRDRIATMPEGRRPRVVNFGESLGAEVALDVATTTADFDLLGIDRGLYLGTPFRTRLWQRWFNNPSNADPIGALAQVAQADEIGTVTAPSAKHIQIVHHDDPINKFSYDTVVRAPWWMGPPDTRPEGVPRETRFRPVTTFIINVIDLKNGMNSKPGDFVRRGHDYRIELREGVQRAYGLAASHEQAERIEHALRAREREWAARRLVARRFDKARQSVVSQFKQWGVDIGSLDGETVKEMAEGNISSLADRLGS